MIAGDLLRVARVVARQWARRADIDGGELQGELLLVLVEAEPDDERMAWEVADWRARSWAYAERERQSWERPH